MPQTSFLPTISYRVTSVSTLRIPGTDIPSPSPASSPPPTLSPQTTSDVFARGIGKYVIVGLAVLLALCLAYILRRCYVIRKKAKTLPPSVRAIYGAASVWGTGNRDNDTLPYSQLHSTKPWNNAVQAEANAGSSRFSRSPSHDSLQSSAVAEPLSPLYLTDGRGVQDLSRSNPLQPWHPNSTGPEGGLYSQHPSLRSLEAGPGHFMSQPSLPYGSFLYPASASTLPEYRPKSSRGTCPPYSDSLWNASVSTHYEARYEATPYESTETFGSQRDMLQEGR